VRYGPTDAEKKSLQYRRSLYVVKDLKAGDVLTAENLRAIRPGLGLAPKYQSIAEGKTLSRDVKRGTALTWEMLG
jgi:sialic acid synthase SpsE